MTNMVSRRMARSVRSAPWCGPVKEELCEAKKQKNKRRSAEKKWLSSGLVAFKLIYSAARKRGSQIVSRAECLQVF